MQFFIGVLAFFLAGATQGSFSRGVTPPLPIPGASVPVDGVLTGGQPTDAQLAQAAALGIRTVINLRAADEDPAPAAEGEQVRRLGMRYVHVPVRAPADLTAARAAQVFAALAAAPGPVLLHCASGNRVGAIFALHAFFHEGRSAEEALAIGDSAGLRSLRGTVRDLLRRER